MKKVPLDDNEVAIGARLDIVGEFCLLVTLPSVLGDFRLCVIVHQTIMMLNGICDRASKEDGISPLARNAQEL